MKKIISLLLMILGGAIIVVKLLFKEFSATLPLISEIALIWVVIVGLILIGIGFLIRKKKVQKSQEVPIYSGENIIGYRRK